MARTQAELGGLLDELTKRVDALTLLLEGTRTISTVEIAHLKDGIREAQALVKELQLGATKVAERIAELEQRCAALEKQSDRGYSFGQAAINSLISMVGSAFISPVVQALLKR